jgi:hypothetical protein
MTQSKGDQEIEGQSVLNWMKQAGLPRAREVLIGLHIDDGTDVHLRKIVDIDPSWVIIASLDGQQKRIPPGLMHQSIVIETRMGWPLRQAINGLKTDGEKSIDFAKQELKALGFPVAKLTNASDAIEALEMMRDFNSARLPTPDQQAERYDIIRRSNLHGLGAKICRQWFAAKWQSAPRTDGSILIKLVYCLRHSGELAEALKTVEFALGRNERLSLSQMQKAILSTERAAVLLDLYEIQRDPGMLKDARKSAAMSFAISQSDEVRAVYQRLKMLEGGS